MSDFYEVTKIFPTLSQNFLKILLVNSNNYSCKLATYRTPVFDERCCQYLVHMYIVKAARLGYASPSSARLWCRPKGASTLCRAAECNTLQFCCAQKLLGICRQCNRVHMKKEFFADLFQVTKTVERDRQPWCDFFLKPADTILKPLIHHMPRGFF